VNNLDYSCVFGKYLAKKYQNFLDDFSVERGGYFYRRGGIVVGCGSRDKSILVEVDWWK